jgi:thioredoxin reductase
MARIVVLGAGFAGLWAAIGAARKLSHAPVGFAHDRARSRLFIKLPDKGLSMLFAKINTSDNDAGGIALELSGREFS